MTEFLNHVYFGNTLLNYLISIGIFVFGIIIIRIIRSIVFSRLTKWSKKTAAKLDDFLINAVEKNIIPLLYLGAFYLAAENIYISAKVFNIINIILIIVVTYFLLKTITSIINYLLSAYIRKKSKGESREKEIRGISTLINILIWTLGLVFLLDNLGFKVSAVITGLGIGGIAVALAAQAILGDLFAYFVIFFDRPFEIGDFIIVGDKLGSVEYVGLKTTRVRSLGGEELVFSNKDLTDSRIHNYKKMERRRVVFKLGVIYQTKAETLEEIPKIVRSVIEAQQDVVFDRGHFAAYGDFSLNFEFVYYVIGADYNKYMDIQQAINLKIFREFEKRKIEFAYPTQTLLVSK